MGMKYFSGTNELTQIRPIRNRTFLAMGGVASRDNYYDSISRAIGLDPTLNAYVPVTRKVFFKDRPSLHKCDGRCMHAKGRNCECSCGGRNHGAGG